MVQWTGGSLDVVVLLNPEMKVRQLVKSARLFYEVAFWVHAKFSGKGFKPVETNT